MSIVSRMCTGAALAASIALTTSLSAGTVTRAPMVCSRGPGNQSFAAILTFPHSAARGSTYAVRIDGVPSGEISHFGLNYIHDMMTDYLVPRGATYVAGSARIVPGTGTANVATTARVWQQDGLIRMLLPGRVVSGSSYVPPSIEFQLEASAPAGTPLALAFVAYRVTANALLVGDVLTTCQPTPTPFPLAATLVSEPPDPPPSR
jgi:hypothetical protein